MITESIACDGYIKNYLLYVSHTEDFEDLFEIIPLSNKMVFILEKLCLKVGQRRRN
jgi:hypothetical protein